MKWAWYMYVAAQSQTCQSIHLIVNTLGTCILHNVVKVEVIKPNREAGTKRKGAHNNTPCSSSCDSASWVNGVFIVVTYRTTQFALYGKVMNKYSNKYDGNMVIYYILCESANCKFTLSWPHPLCLTVLCTFDQICFIANFTVKTIVWSACYWAQCLAVRHQVHVCITQLSIRRWNHAAAFDWSSMN